MKRILLSALFLAGMTGLATAQVKMDELKTSNSQSPNADTKVTIQGKEVWIFYHAPSVRGRKIFGGADALQKDGTIWRLGADYATVLHTDADLDLGRTGRSALYGRAELPQEPLILHGKGRLGAHLPERGRRGS